MKDHAVDRPPLDPEQTTQDIIEAFAFSNLTPEQEADCAEVQDACQKLALLIADKLPEGKEHTVAINNVLAAALWVRHGISRRKPVLMGTTAPPCCEP